MLGRADVQKQDYFNVSKTFDNLPHQVWEHQWAYLGSAKGPAVVLGEPPKSPNFKIGKPKTCNMFHQSGKPQHQTGSSAACVLSRLCYLLCMHQISTATAMCLFSKCLCMSTGSGALITKCLTSRVRISSVLQCLHHGR